MKFKNIRVVLSAFLICLLLSSCVSREVKSIAGLWENKEIGTVEFRSNKTYVFTLPFEVLSGEFTVSETELIISTGKKSSENFKYYYAVKGDVLILSMRQDMKELFGSENLIFERVRK